MKIYFAGDHAGFELKKVLMEYVQSLGHDVEDCGPYSFDPNDDYPDYVIPMAKKVAGQPSERVRGIVAAGSGQGEMIATNRIKGVRAVVYYGNNPSMMKVSRDHNDSNVVTIGTRFVEEADAKEAVKIWLETPFSNEERHKRRLAKIEELSA